MQNSSAFQYLAIDTIGESTTNPRRTFEENKLQELAESIRHHGLIQPVIVYPNADGFELIAGAETLRAAKLYNPQRDGRGGIRGGCSTCFTLLDLHQPRLTLGAANRNFIRKAAPGQRFVSRQPSRHLSMRNVNRSLAKDD